MSIHVYFCGKNMQQCVAQLSLETATHTNAQCTGIYGPVDSLDTFFYDFRCLAMPVWGSAMRCCIASNAFQKVPGTNQLVGNLYSRTVSAFLNLAASFSSERLYSLTVSFSLKDCRIESFYFRCILAVYTDVCRFTARRYT